MYEIILRVKILKYFVDSFNCLISVLNKVKITSVRKYGTLMPQTALIF